MQLELCNYGTNACANKHITQQCTSRKEPDDGRSNLQTRLKPLRSHGARNSRAHGKGPWARRVMCKERQVGRRFEVKELEMKQTRYHSTKGGVGLYRLLSVFVTLSLVAGLVPSQSIAYAREGLAEADGVGVVEAVGEAAEGQVAEPEVVAEEATTDSEGQAAVTPDQEAEAEPAQAEGEEAAEDDSDDQAVADEATVDESPEAGEAATETGEEAAPEKKADGGKLTAKAGDATVTASYDEGTFEGPVTLHAENVDEGDARYGKVTDALDELAETNDAFDYDHARALDIWFENEAGEKVEPAKYVRVSISFGEAISQKAVSTDLVHIPDDGPAELIDDARVADDGSKASFMNDEFSVYVVTANEAQHDGSVAVGDAYYTTLAEAVENAQDGSTINIIGETADTEAVAIDKSVTILSDGADGSLPKGIDANGGTITLGGGNNTLTMGAVWGTTGNEVTLNVENGVHITGGMPVYLYGSDATLNVHGGKIEQTQTRSNWNNAIGLYDASIGEITGGQIVGLGDGIYVYGGAINTISGGTISGADGDGINLGWADLNTLSGGDISGSAHGIYVKSGNVGTISGGTVTGGTDGIFLESWSKIGSISGGTFKGESTSEGAGLNVDGGRCEVGTISGGVFIGCDAVRVNAELDNGSLIISNGVFKATSGSGYAVTPDAEANFTSSFSDGKSPVRFTGKLDDGSYTVPEGYAPSTDTVSVSGVDGDFHYFARIITITYDGNGGKTESNKTTYTEKVSGPFQAADCDFIGPDSKVFKEWNTKASGDGDSYAEGADVTPDGEMTLYAIWELIDGPVSIVDVVYPNIRAAMAEAQDGDTIVVNKNCTDTSDPIVVDKNVTIVAGDENVTSTGANLKVNTGKTLTLGSGDASGSTLTFKGGVNVTDGHVLFQDGIDLRKTLSLNGTNATGTITGGKIKTSSGAAIKLDGSATIDSISGGSFSSSATNALEVFLNSSIDTITSGKFVSTSGHGMDLYGTVGTISGDDTEFTGSACGIYVRSQGALNTIESGQFSSSTTNSPYVKAGLFVQGKCNVINGGTFTGSQGAQFGHTTSFISPEYPADAGVKINGGTFHGGQSYGIDFVANSSSTILECSIKNATISSVSNHALDINGGYHFSEISNVTVTAADGEGIITQDIGGSTKPLNIDKIVDSTFSSMHLGRDTHVPTINNVTVTGETQFGGWNEDRPAEIGTVSSSSFGRIYVACATITKIDSIKVTDSMQNSENGTIDLITGDTEMSGRWYALDNEGKIGTIESGKYTSEIGINNCESGVIDSITAAVEGGLVITGTDGPAVLNVDDATITAITGHGVYVGTEYAIQATGGTVNVEPDLSDEHIGNGRYQSTSNTPDSEFDGVTLPSGYHVVKSTTDGSVEGADGSFRYLVKDNTVTYDGNGHTTADGDDTVTKTYETGKPEAASNDEVAFQDDGWYFDGWNTEPNGSGTSYKPGDKIDLDGSDVVLYAQWESVYTIAFDANGGSGSMDPVTAIYSKPQNLPANEFTKPGYTFTGWNTKADGSGTGYADKAEVLNLASEDGATVTLYAQWAPNDSRISYNANGGEGKTADTEGKTDEVVKVAESGFELEGHTFVGWNTEPDGSGDAYAPGDDFTLLPEATVLYAQWEINENVIIFDPNGGTYEGSADPTSETHDYGDVITMKAPERDGYTFLYWKGSEYYVGDEYTVTEDHTFVAQWEKSEEPKPSPKPTPKKATPQTGDPAATMPLALFAGTGLGLLLAAAVLRRRKA